MKKEKLMAVISAAVTLFTVTAALTVHADDSAALLPAENGELNEDCVEYLEGSSDDLPVLVSRRLFSAAGEDDDLLDRCIGNRWGYKDMLKRSNGEMRQRLYEELDRTCRTIWYTEGELTLSMTTSGKTILFRINNEYGLSNDEVIESYYTFLYDNPIYYYIGSNIGLYSDGDFQVYSSPDVLAADTRAEYQELIKDYCESSAELVSRERTAYTNALAIYDRVIADMDYAYKSDGVSPSTDFKAHSVIGGIAEHEGVCDSYAKVLRLLYNYNGIDNVLVTGNGERGGHSWNMIRLDDGEYYSIDATWDDNMNDRSLFACGESYFIGQGHTADTPSQTGVSFLYELPGAPNEGFSLAKYFGDLALDMDADGDGGFTELDIRAMQNRLTDSELYGEPRDIDLDGVTNNRDLKEMQMLLIRYTNGK